MGLRWLCLLCAVVLAAPSAEASVGLLELPGNDGDGVVTIFYPSTDEAKPVKRGPFTFQLAVQGAPVRGNGRLVVISHGSGGSPWLHANLAQTLAGDGFVVAVPEHRGDNYKDHSTPGPESWKQRPAEVSRTIDAVGQEARLRPLLSLDRVGMYGMSAGGHTALTLAGGRWSPAGFRRHCEAHISEDFPACVGLITGCAATIWMDRRRRSRSGSSAGGSATRPGRPTAILASPRSSPPCLTRPTST